MTDHDAELPETVAVHIKWLRRPSEVSNNDAAYRADNRQSADYLSRLLGVAHRLAERAETAEAEATQWRLYAETLAAADIPLTAEEFKARYIDGTDTGDPT